MNNEQEGKSITDYTVEELRELARQKEEKPYLDDLARLEESAADIAAKHKKTARRVLQDCADRFPKLR